MSSANRSSPRRRFVAFWTALALLGGVGLATMWSFTQAANSIDWVEHTYRVIATLQQYRVSVREAESSARGYRISGNTLLREQFFDAVPRAEQAAEEVSRLVADNSGQSVRSRMLEELTTQRLALSRRLVESAETKGAPVPSTTAGATTMSRIDALAGRMLATEQVLLAERRARRQAQARLLMFSTGGGTALAVVLLALLMRGLQRETRHSRQLEKQARDAASGLEASLAQISLLADQRGALGRHSSLLQSCENVEEALQVTGQAIAELLPGTGGRCYLLRASQDLAETASAFGTPAAASTNLLQPRQCWALRRGQAYRVEDLATGVPCAHVDANAAEPGSWTLCVPLLAQGNALGLLYVSGHRAEDSARAEEVCDRVAGQLGLALVNLQLRETLRHQSLRDSLTGLFNRRYLDESLPREITRCQRRGLPLAVMMLDVDHFKAFNDDHGHAGGDALLAAIGHTLQSMARSEDLVCRYGGEEFTLVLADSDPAEALQRADEIRIAVGRTTVEYLRQALGPCTASVGIAMLPGDGDAPDTLLRKADAALYRAKACGRDRVVAAADADLPSP